MMHGNDNEALRGAEGGYEGIYNRLVKLARKMAGADSTPAPASDLQLALTG